MPVTEQPTVKFILEIAAGKDPFETALWDSVRRGKWIRRRVSTGKKIHLHDRESFGLYAARQQRFLSYAAEHGIHPADKPVEGDHSDVDIGIAIFEQGVFHYRTGHHRLGYALALGISTIPVRCYFASARAVAKIAERDKSRNWREAVARYLDSLGGTTA